MSTVTSADRLAPVSAPDTPSQTAREWGAALKARASASPLTIKTIGRLASVSRGTVYSVFNGEAPVDTMRAVQEALDFAEANPGDVPEQAGAIQRVGDQIIEFEVNVDAIGVRVVVRGPIENAEQLEAQAAKLIRDMRATTEGQDQKSP